MWIFTKYGFFSSVCAKMGDGEPGMRLDPDRIMIRARVLAHLEALVSRFPELRGYAQINTSPNADYAFRIIIPKLVWTQILANLAEETDYGNFKSHVAQYQRDDGDAYLDSLNEVWSVMHRLQVRAKPRN